MGSRIGPGAVSLYIPDMMSAAREVPAAAPPAGAGSFMRDRSMPELRLKDEEGAEEPRSSEGSWPFSALRMLSALLPPLNFSSCES